MFSPLACRCNGSGCRRSATEVRHFWAKEDLPDLVWSMMIGKPWPFGKLIWKAKEHIFLQQVNHVQLYKWRLFHLIMVKPSKNAGSSTSRFPEAPRSHGLCTQNCWVDPVFGPEHWSSNLPHGGVSKTSHGTDPHGTGVELRSRGYPYSLLKGL